jgi:tetratricopeptide (TPR) repeat protein
VGLWLLERTWGGITGLLRQAPTPSLFRRADRLRLEGRHDEAAVLVAQGLEQSPDSAIGHLLSAYLHLARRETGPATLAFERVLRIDRYHPRALLGLARIALEEGDLERSKDLLDRALQFYADFPEARALRDLVESWSASTPAATAPLTAPDLEGASPWRDLVAVRLDGTLISARAAGERADRLATHTTRICQVASATLGRAGLGPLRRGLIETGAERTLLWSDGGVILSATVDAGVDSDDALADLGRLRNRLGLDG